MRPRSQAKKPSQATLSTPLTTQLIMCVSVASVDTKQQSISIAPTQNENALDYINYKLRPGDIGIVQYSTQKSISSRVSVAKFLCRAIKSE